jgi:hypothetical protein
MINSWREERENGRREDGKGEEREERMGEGEGGASKDYGVGDSTGVLLNTEYMIVFFLKSMNSWYKGEEGGERCERGWEERRWIRVFLCSCVRVFVCSCVRVYPSVLPLN